jgi:hypothetical protein
LPSGELVGVIALAGIIMRNSVILVDQIEQDKFMDDHPLAVRLAITNRRAHPNISFFAACPLPGDAIETMAEGSFRARPSFPSHYR